MARKWEDCLLRAALVRALSLIGRGNYYNPSDDIFLISDTWRPLSRALYRNSFAGDSCSLNIYPTWVEHIKSDLFACQAARSTSYFFIFANSTRVCNGLRTVGCKILRQLHSSTSRKTLQQRTAFETARASLKCNVGVRNEISLHIRRRER